MISLCHNNCLADAEGYTPVGMTAQEKKQKITEEIYVLAKLILLTITLVGLTGGLIAGGVHIVRSVSDRSLAVQIIVDVSMISSLASLIFTETPIVILGVLRGIAAVYSIHALRNLDQRQLNRMNA